MLISEQVLCERAAEVRERAYAPYSGYTVGAALLCGSGRVYTGCNVENAAYGSTVCAERVALYKAISEGERQFLALAVCGGKAGEDITGVFPPCGACRQVIAEFCRPEFPILVVTQMEPLFYENYTLDDLLPKAFTAGYLQNQI